MLNNACRVYALHHHRTLSLHASIDEPTVGDDPQEMMELPGFCHLISLFKPFDDTFVGLWNKTSSGCTSAWMAQLQAQLTTALPPYPSVTETQAVDLRTCQQWLRTMVWQLSISQGVLSSSAADPAMSFKYPIDISHDVIASLKHFSQQAMELHGIALVYSTLH
jgi:hypothetical protein